MSLWDRIEADRDAVLLNDFDGMTCTAIQLTTGRTFTGFFYEVDSERDAKFGVANCLKGRLWIPSSATPKQQEQWQVILPDGKRLEVTCVSFGVRSGSMIEIRTEQVDVTRFGAASFGGK